MIERIPDQISVQTGEWRGTTFDIIPKETFAMACRKINQLVDAVNEQQKQIDKMSFAILDLATPNGENKALESIKLDRTRKALDKGMEHITGLNNMIESWLNLINSDLDQETKLRILKSAISAYVENKGSNNEK